MVDDILLSPEEQDERAKQWLKDNGLALILGVVLGLGTVFGYNLYKDRQITNAEQASALYDAVLDAVKQSDVADIESQVSNLKKDYAGSSYAAKAVLLRARQLAVSDLAAALNELRWVGDNTTELGLLHTARIRQAKILMAQGELDAAKTLAGTEPYDGFDTHYYEILGDVGTQQESFSQARDDYQKAIDSIGAGDAAYRSVLNLKMNRLPADAQAADTQAGDVETTEVEVVDKQAVDEQPVNPPAAELQSVNSESGEKLASETN